MTFSALKDLLAGKRQQVVSLLTIVIWAACFFLGIWLSLHRPLWNDELYTHVGIIERVSFAEIVWLEIQEGNICPLFYVIQKGLMGVLSFQLPLDWRQEWQLVDGPSQVIMRLQPNVFMSLSLAMMFYFFARRYSVGAGVYSLGISLSSFMVWAYWAEARPYALWFFLTTLQSLMFLFLLKKDRMTDRDGYALTAVHLLLALTVIFGVVQILAVSLLLYLFKDRRAGRYIYLTLLPATFSVFYYLKSPHFQFWFQDSPLQLLAANFPKDRILILTAYGLSWLGGILWEQKGGAGRRTSGYLAEAKIFFLYTVMMVGSGIAILVMFWLGDTKGAAGFQISNRYLIYLTPVSIIATTLLSLDLVRSWRGKRAVQVFIILILAILLVMRTLRVLALAQGLFKGQIV